MTNTAATKAARRGQAEPDMLEPEECPTCERLTIVGLGPADMAVRVDVQTVELGGELVAMLEGRMTYARFGHLLAPRTSGRGVREAPPGGLYVLHVCALVPLGHEVFRVGRCPE